MIIEKVTRDTYADQLTRRIIIPLRLHSLCYAPYTCPAADAARMPAGYFFNSTVANQEPPDPPVSLLGKQVPPLAPHPGGQGSGGIVSSLQDMTMWDRALYQGRELPPPQQRQLESLVSTTTGQPVPGTTPPDPVGYGLGVYQGIFLSIGTVWFYEGVTYGYRVLHLYVPRSGVIIALAANSDPRQRRRPGHARDVGVPGTAKGRRSPGAAESRPLTGQPARTARPTISGILDSNRTPRYAWLHRVRASAREPLRMAGACASLKLRTDHVA